MKKKYFFSFDRFIGNDRVLESNFDIDLSDGDLIKIGNEYFLVLGEDLSFEENYKYFVNLDFKYCEIVEKKFLSKKTLDIIHYLVYQYFSTYKNVLGLFVDFDIQDLLARKQENKSKPKYLDIHFDENNHLFQIGEEKKSGQILVVMPDIWTVSNFFDIDKSSDDLLILNSSMTKKQKNESFWKIKNGKISTVVSTYSQVFQDWYDLKKIILIDSHKWYYKNQQDPRYWTPTVIKKISEIYKSDLAQFGMILYN